MRIGGMHSGRGRGLCAAGLSAALVSVAAAAPVGVAGPLSRSGIAGVVLRGPVTPVCRPDVPCDAPTAGVAVTVSKGARLVARAVTGNDGGFRFRLPAGVYVVRASWRGGIVRVPQSRLVRVAADRTVQLRFFFDTGIR